MLLTSQKRACQCVNELKWNDKVIAESWSQMGSNYLFWAMIAAKRREAHGQNTHIVVRLHHHINIITIPLTIPSLSQQWRQFDLRWLRILLLSCFTLFTSLTQFHTLGIKLPILLCWRSSHTSTPSSSTNRSGMIRNVLLMATSGLVLFSKEFVNAVSQPRLIGSLL